MTPWRRVELACWTLAGVMTVTAVVASRTGGATDRMASGAPFASVPAGVRVSPDTIAAAARVVVESDPFRFDRRPAAVPYQPGLEGVAPPPKPPKPALALLGLVGSARGRWAALLDGVPGRAGTALVHAGDTLAGLRVRRVGRDTVIVTGADTTWRLTVRQVWQ